MPVPRRSGQERHIMRRVRTESEEFDSNRLLHRLESEPVKAALKSWYQVWQDKMDGRRSTIENFAGLVSKRAYTWHTSHTCDFAENTTDNHPTSLTGRLAAIGNSAQAVQLLIVDAGGTEIFLNRLAREKSILVSAWLLNLICLDIEQGSYGGWLDVILPSQHTRSRKLAPRRRRYKGSYFIPDYEDEGGISEDDSDGQEEKCNSQNDENRNKEGDDNRQEEDNSIKRGECNEDVGNDNDTDDSEDILQNFIVEEAEYEPEQNMQDDDGTGENGFSCTKIRGGTDKEVIRGSSHTRRPLKRKVSKEYGIFQRSWAHRQVEKGRQNHEYQRHKPARAALPNPKRRKYGAPSQINVEEDDDEDFFDQTTKNNPDQCGPPKTANNSESTVNGSPDLAQFVSRCDTSLECSNQEIPPPRIASQSVPPSTSKEDIIVQYWKEKAFAAQEREVSALHRLQTITKQAERAERAVEIFIDRGKKLQGELQEAIAARNTAEQEMRVAKAESAEVRGKHENLGKALREAGFAFTG
ncbi:MAG: hypothetical protein M1822_009267 [Bathelium mastoideum]|nr:MAG: hypothetical protein M1822_009267 [Bathelium mastoideum]